MLVKTNGTIINKHKHLHQLSVRELHNDTILPIYEGVFLCARTADGKLCIGDNSLRK